MRKVQKWQILAIVAIIILAGINEDWFSYPHRTRFENFMETNNIEFSDAGCEYGWAMTSFRPWSGPNGKNQLQKGWNEVAAIDYEALWMKSDSIDVLNEYGCPEIREERGDTLVYIYVDYLEFTFLNDTIHTMKSL